jgi:uncharacterized protein YjbI with pentapeptide repeats
MQLDLESVDLRGANLVGAHLEGADLGEAHLDGANLIQARLEGANLAEASFDADTVWPDWFDPVAAGARRSDADEADEPTTNPAPE